MASPRKYVHDHLILLLLSVNGFLAIAGSIFTLIRLSTSHSSSYIIQYRSNIGINDYKTGSVAELISFVPFVILVLVFHTFMSLRAYRIHRQLAIAILGLGSLLLILAMIVSYELLSAIR